MQNFSVPCARLAVPMAVTNRINFLYGTGVEMKAVRNKNHGARSI